MLNISSRNTNNISFKALPPPNYKKIDEFVSRSAQPNEENFKWLKEQGVTDVINFRTMIAPAIDFNEAEVSKKLGITYHNIPTSESDLNKQGGVEEKLSNFFDIVDNIRALGKKVHLHCKAGADRTGFFSLLYKSRYNIDTFEQNAAEMLEMGHNQNRYPNIINYVRAIICTKLNNLI